MVNIDVFLSEIGLTEIQIEVYKIVLAYPGLGVTEISEKLHVNRSHVYSIARKLIDLELIYEDFSHRMELYPNEIEKIGERLKDKSNSIEGKFSDFSSSLSLIKELYTSSSLSFPRMQIYHGVKGKKESINKLLSSANQYSSLYLMTNQKTERNIFSKNDHNEFIKKRVGLEINIKVLAVDNEEGRELCKNSENILRETHLLNRDFYFDSEIYVIKNTLLLYDLVPDLVGIMIESEQMAKIYKNLFEVAWDNYSHELQSS